MKRLLIALLCFILCLAALPALAEDMPEVYTSGDVDYVVLEDGTAEIAGCFGDAAALEIPAELDGMPVTRIGKEAFFRATLMESVAIPEGVESIGDKAFAYCFKLASVSIPRSVESIGYGAFSECSDDLMITVVRGSCAEAYCGENGLAFTSVD